MILFVKQKHFASESIADYVFVFFPYCSSIEVDNVSLRASLTFMPPFHCSYQCSSSLIQTFAFVFIYRYIFIGIIEPLSLIILKQLQQHYAALSSIRYRPRRKKKNCSDSNSESYCWKIIVTDFNC
jgi:hypothetical protein